MNTNRWLRSPESLWWMGIGLLAIIIVLVIARRVFG